MTASHDTGGFVNIKNFIQPIRPSALCAGVFAFAASHSPLVYADLASTLQFDIAAQQLPAALLQYSEQSGVQISSLGEAIEGKFSSSVTGKYEARGALEQLLRGTQLIYDVIDENTVAIRDAKGHGLKKTGVAAATHLLLARTADESSAAEGVESSSSQKTEFSSKDDSERLEEIIVSAQKREERLQDVPIPVSVLTPNTLISNGKTNFLDYFSQVPGVSVAGSGGGMVNVVIRGLSVAGFSNPGVGLTIDDAPYGATTALGGGASIIDFDPGDLARIEVLRGPQGTLYGASSIAGLIKYVTVDPSTDASSARVSMSTESIENGEGFGYTLRGSTNVRLSDVFAVRASAFTRHDAGYIRDTIHNRDGVNSGRAYGGRLAALWRPTDNVSVKLSAMRQILYTDAPDRIDWNTATVTADKLENSSFVPNYTRTARSVNFITGTVNAGIRGVDLTSITAYSQTRLDFRDHLTALDFAAPRTCCTQDPTKTIVEYGGDSFAYQYTDRPSKFSQEVKMTTPLGSHLDWLLGVFYTEERGRHFESGTSVVQLTGAVVSPIGQLFCCYTGTTYKEAAAFTALTVKFTDQFDIQLGARQSENRQTLFTISDGDLYDLSQPRIDPTIKSKDDSLSYLISPRWRVSPSFMIYGRLAEGYRPGGPNYNNAATIGEPTVSADTTTNYELGVKGDILGRFLSVDASVYRIDWEDIQVTLVDPAVNLSYVANAGTARSEGVEISLEARPIDGLKVSAWGAWVDAKMTSLTNFSKPGQRIPSVAPRTGNIAVDYERPIWAEATGFIGTSLKYVGAFPKNFGDTVPPTPSYTQWDMHAGFELDDWQVNAFVNNIADKRGIVAYEGFGAFAHIIKPRTIGVSIAKSFE